MIYGGRTPSALRATARYYRDLREARAARFADAQKHVEMERTEQVRLITESRERIAAIDAEVRQTEIREREATRRAQASARHTEALRKASEILVDPSSDEDMREAALGLIGYQEDPTKPSDPLLDKLIARVRNGKG